MWRQTARLFALLAVAAALGSAAAQEAAPPAPIGPEDRAARIERLFERLAQADSAEAANRFSASIEALWLRSGSDTADLLTGRALEALKRKQSDEALTLLDAVVEIEPGHAEAWNKRATLLFLKGDYARSMRDIRETLAREPRHWGAWGGLARILEDSGDERRALDAYRRALAIHPHLPGIKDKIRKLAIEVQGRAL